MANGPIVYIEDDLDDVLIFEQVFDAIGVPHQLIVFENANDALDYFCSTTDLVFLILCDINLPGKNGLELKSIIDSTPELRRKSIPFVFFSTTAGQNEVDLAYTKLTVQGFFQKPNDIKKMSATIKLIIDYWTSCRHPKIY